MQGLMLHCGASSVERQQVLDAPTPPPTKTHYPVPHEMLLNDVTESLLGSGLRITEEAHGLTKEGNRYFGLLSVANGENGDDFDFVVGLRNSHDKAFSASLALGARVFVCDNLCFSGEVTIARKHTRNIFRDLHELTHRAVGRLGEFKQVVHDRHEKYKGHEITDERAHDLMIRAIDSKIVAPSKITKVIDEWREPQHEQFTEHGQSIWRLYNAFTEQLKGALGTINRRSEALHGLLDPAAGMYAPVLTN